MRTNPNDPLGREIVKGKDIISRRHTEWSEHVLRWRWLQDTYEGGDRYRQAIYGSDTRGLPVRNMVRHKREYPDPRERALTQNAYMAGTANGLAGMVGMLGAWGDTVAGGVIGPGATPGALGSDPLAMATDDDYEMRRARTPVPTFLSEVIDIHLGKLFSREVDRDLKYPELEEWATDVDGVGNDLDTWVSEIIAPLLFTIGHVDICFDHPPAPKDLDIVTRYDEIVAGVTGCVASYILPQNVLWWRLDATLAYEEVLIREYSDPDVNAAAFQYRHWTKEQWTLYGSDGEVIDQRDHGYGLVPIRRVFDKRKPRCRNVGMPRWEGVAERQREYYNRDSELILSDTLQAQPLLQGPEDYCTADAKIPIGPNWLLPKKRNGTDGQTITYEGFDVVEFPKGAAESIRQNMADIRESVDRQACLVKPAGASGTGKGTVGQSGISKKMDNDTGNALLTKYARTLARAEREILGMALVVLRDDPKAKEAAKECKIAYPTVFDLVSAEDMAAIWAEFQTLVTTATTCPETNIVALAELVRKILAGRDDEFYDTVIEEIREAIEENKDRESQSAELALFPPQAVQTAVLGDQEDQTDLDPSGTVDDDGGMSPPVTASPAMAS